MFVLTANGVKSYPLRGALAPGVPMPTRYGIDLLGLNRSVAYDALYRQQPWVNIVVNKLARGVGMLPWGAFTDDTSPEPLPDSELHYLIHHPYPRGSASSLKQAITGSTALYGHSIVALDRPGIGRPPSALWPIPWRYVQVLEGDDNYIGGYIIQIGNVRRLLLPEDVLHFQWWSPLGLGVSPLEPLRTTLALEEAAQRYSVSSFANGARPSGAVSTESPMTKPDRDMLKAEIQAMHGGVDNAFRIALLTNGLKWQPFSHSAQESELINLRKLNREEVVAVYDIPPSSVHILDRATFSNIDEQHRMLYQDTFGPWITMEEETIHAQLVEPEPVFKGQRVKTDLDGVLRGDADKRSTAAQRWFQAGVATPNEGRAAEGKPPAPGSLLPDGNPDPEHPANQVYVPVNMIPVDQAKDAAAAPAAAADPTLVASMVRALEITKARSDG